MLLYHWIMNSFAIVILITVKIAYTTYGKSANIRYTLFNWILYVAMVLLIFETPSRYDGLVTSYYPIFNQVGNFMLFLFSPILPSLWFIIVYSQIFDKELPSKRVVWTLLSANILHLSLILASQFFGWVYSIDASNIYHRGPLFFASPLLTISLLLASLILVVVQHKRITRNILIPFLIFPIPALLGVGLQAVTYGIDFSLKGLVIAILIYFIFVLTHQMTIDYLTGVYNRKGLDEYLKKLYRNLLVNKNFTVIMLDLDDFKSVNDRFGHAAGDHALKSTVQLIKSSLNQGDFVGRYGGDEFFIIFENQTLQQVQPRIEALQHAFRSFNQNQEQSYRLHYSLGIVMYDPLLHHSVDDLKKDLDRSLYENKAHRN